MFLATVFGLSLFGLRRRSSSPTDDLDVALAGAQIGLEKKRQRWLLFLIEKEEQCLSSIAQTTEIDSLEGLEGSLVADMGTGEVLSLRGVTAEMHSENRNSHDS